MVQPTRFYKQKLMVKFESILIPRRVLLKTMVFQDNLPIDIDIRMRLFRGDEELVPWLYTSY